ncbi:MAG: SLATT domain-containing protein [Bacteroidales bacterium]|nr:SLATT domain-containing protein [Bacteroidales bacterium]
MLWKRNNALKIIQIILSALTTSGLIAVILSNNNSIATYISTFLSAILLGINLYCKNNDLGGLAQKHASAAVDLWNIRESYLSLLTDINSETIEIEQVIIKRDELQNKLKDIYKGAPRTIAKAYDNASQALKQNEEMTFSNEEINILLPEKLRK